MKITDIFTVKELEVIALMDPPKTAEEVITIVMKDWFQNNLQRMHEQVKTQAQVIDEVIAKSKGKGVI